MNGVLGVLSGIYLILGIIYFIIAIHRIVQKNSIAIFDCMRLMYAFVFGIFPALLYWKESTGIRNLYYYDYSSSGLVSLFLLCLFSVIAYGCLNLAYFSIQKEPVLWVGHKEDAEDTRELLAAGVILLVLGLFSLLLWTRAYGSLNEFILNASTIRSGRGEYNRFAFMKQFTRVLPFSLYAFISYYCKTELHGMRRLFVLIMIVTAAFGSYLYLLASDSRVTIAYTGIGIMLIIIRNRKSNDLKRYLFGCGILIVALLVLTMSADVITRYSRYGVWETSDVGFIDSLISEFRFTQSSEMMAMNMANDGLKIKLFDDLINALTSWIPERFIPFTLPNTIWTYNTLNITGVTTRGTSPCDLIAASIYEIGLLGVVVFPFLWGAVCGFADKKIGKAANSLHSDVYFAGMATIFIGLVSHNQIYSFALSCFPVFLYYLVSKFVGKIKIGRYSL